MAIAGRVAIVPKGEYDASAVYKRLDLVKYGLGAYVARRGNTGVIPYQEDTETWMLLVSSEEGVAAKITYDNTLSGLIAEDVQVALDELAGKTEIAQAPSAENPDGKLGIMMPDGETIQIDENGVIRGAATGFTGTREEYEDALAAKEIKDGMQVNITDDFEKVTVVDKELSLSSENPVQNKVITAALEGISGAMGGITFSVTEAGLVRASWDDEQEG